MRYRFRFAALCALVVLVACKEEVSTPMAEAPIPRRPLFAVGSVEQQQLDKFLSRFPAEKADEFYQIFATRRTILAATNPVLQQEIEEIYAAMNARDSGKPPAIVPHNPGPVEAALIEKFLAGFPPTEASNLRVGLMSSNANVQSKDPAIQKRLDAIYQARIDEAAQRAARGEY